AAPIKAAPAEAAPAETAPPAPPAPPEAPAPARTPASTAAPERTPRRAVDDEPPTEVIGPLAVGWWTDHDGAGVDATRSTDRRDPQPHSRRAQRRRQPRT